MPDILRVTPVNVQVRYKATFSPPNYDLVTTEVAVALARKLAEIFNLKSSGIIFNQNSMSAQYLSFRHVLPNEPIRYLDALIGVDQAEVIFLNPATVSELREECLKVWNPIIEISKPSITEHYFEASVHSATEGVSAKDFLNKFVTIQPNALHIQKGFSLMVKCPEILGEARVGLEVSSSIPDGLYLVFGCTSKTKVKNTGSLQDLFDKTIGIYRRLQPLAHIEVLEAM
jgi:hypothetical protein